MLKSEGPFEPEKAFGVLVNALTLARGHRPRAMVICSDKSVADDEDLDIEVTDSAIHVTTSVEEATEFFRAGGEFVVVTTSTRARPQ